MARRLEGLSILLVEVWRRVSWDDRSPWLCDDCQKATRCLQEHSAYYRAVVMMMVGGVRSRRVRGQGNRLGRIQSSLMGCAFNSPGRL